MGSSIWTREDREDMREALAGLAYGLAYHEARRAIIAGDPLPFPLSTGQGQPIGGGLADLMTEPAHYGTGWTG